MNRFRATVSTSLGVVAAAAVIGVAASGAAVAATLSPAVIASIADVPRDGAGDSVTVFPQSRGDYIRRDSAVENRAIAEFALSNPASLLTQRIVLSFDLDVSPTDPGESFRVGLYPGNGSAQVGDFAASSAPIATVTVGPTADEASFVVDVSGPLHAAIAQGASVAGFRFEFVDDASYIARLQIPELETLVRGPGDFDFDGDADGADLLVWQRQLGSSRAAFTGADGNGDGVVNHADLGLWRSSFGPATGVNAAAVPEPAAAILAAGLAWLAGKRRV